MAPESATIEGGYAVEAEFQVLGVASGFCEQNFGVVAVAADGATYLGGGLLYFCDGSKPMARITDVSNWVDGYNRDQEFSSARLDLGTGWHTLRLEVGPGGVRLLIDDKMVLEGVDPTGVAGGSQTAQWGVWSQGVRVAIRRIAVEPLAVPV